MGRTESLTSECALADVRFNPVIDDFEPKVRSYLHFDFPISKLKRKKFDCSSTILRSHSFWPLLAYTKVERRTKPGDDGKIRFTEKPREIKFASHNDAAIMEWAVREISKEYEHWLARSTFPNSVLAYRSGVGDNVVQAAEIFDRIKALENCTAIAMDVSKFFDTIRHDNLLSSLQKISAGDSLDDGFFSLYKAMTKFAWVEISELQTRLGRKHPVNGRLCSPQEFRTLIRRQGDSLVNTNGDNFGIPQGTPLSGLYANISMIEFDRIISNYVKKRGGFYRRYSDDICILLPSDVCEKLAVRHVKKNLRLIGLAANERKTEISRFEITDHIQNCDKPFQYLGFLFDGNKTIVRQSSLNRYYSKMRRGIRAKVLAAKKKNVPSAEIYMRELYKRYTHFGKKRNFPRYAYRASKILDAPEIQKQLSGHMSIFNKVLQEEINRIY